MAAGAGKSLVYHRNLLVSKLVLRNRNTSPYLHPFGGLGYVGTAVHFPYDTFHVFYLVQTDGQFTRKFLDGNYFEDGKPGLELYPIEILFVGHDKKKKDQEGMQQLSPWACAQVRMSQPSRFF